MNKILRAVDSLSVWLARIAMALLVALVGAMLYEVVSRRVFNAPTLWAFDVSYMLNGTIYLGAAGYTLLRNEHIRIDFFSTRLPVRVQHAINAALYLLLFLPALFLICRSAFGDAWYAWTSGEVERVSPWAPVIWPYYTAIATGLGVFFAQCVAQALRHLAGLVRGTAFAAPETGPDA